jgi:hypothetical protein
MLVAPEDLPLDKNLVAPLARLPSPAGARPSAVELPYTSRCSEPRPRWVYIVLATEAAAFLLLLNGYLLLVIHILSK